MKTYVGAVDGPHYTWKTSNPLKLSSVGIHVVNVGWEFDELQDKIVEIYVN